MCTSEPISLKNFFIYNSKLGSKEGEEDKKILFYHPPDVSLDTKMRDVGFSEAIVNFTSTFTSDKSCHTMQTLKTSQFYFQAEPDFWMAMTVNAPFDTRTREGGEFKEYKSDTVHGGIFRSVLEESYKMFRMFYGKFQESFVGDSPEERSLALQSKFEDFFSVYLRRLTVHNCDIIDAFRSVQYLPVDQQLFLRIHNFVNGIESTYPTIQHCVLLHDKRVVWSGLKPDHLYTFNEYLCHTPLSSHTEDFVLGPARCEQPAVSVFLYEDGEERKEYRMVVFSAKNILCCMLLLDDKPPQEDFYADIRVPLKTHLVAISSEIDLSLGHSSSTVPATMSPKQLQSTGTASGPEARYLYLNGCSLRHSGPLTGKHGAMSRDLINILMDLYEETDERNISEETIVKTLNDYWIFRKNCNSRCFFVLINKYATLIEIADEATKLFGQHVQDVFFD